MQRDLIKLLPMANQICREGFKDELSKDNFTNYFFSNRRQKADLVKSTRYFSWYSENEETGDLQLFQDRTIDSYLDQPASREMLIEGATEFPSVRVWRYSGSLQTTEIPRQSVCRWSSHYYILEHFLSLLISDWLGMTQKRSPLTGHSEVWKGKWNKSVILDMLLQHLK